MNAPTPFLTDLIQSLRAYSQQHIQPQWHGLYAASGGSLETALQQGALWDKMPLNERQHIAWPQGRALWLYQRLRVPETLHGYPLDGLKLRLATAWWAEDVQLYVNGELAQTGDLFDFFTELCLAESVTPGQWFDVVLRLESPKHDAGALVRSQLIYEAPNHPISPEPGFVADELQVLQHYLYTLAPEKLPEVETLLTRSWQSSGENHGNLPHDDVSHGNLHQRLAHLRQCLLPYGQWLKQRRIHCVGHAHLDLAWLWPIADTWQAAERTFESVLALQQDFPELTYTHSSPALFAWLEAHRPELFQRIQHQVQAGAWSIDAGMWVEPELNIVGGEAIARQLLYGQQYCQEKFGTRSLIAWLPDTFGFCSQLPQLLKLGGVEVFATQKLRWNDTTQFPHDLFRWQGPDGSEILGWTLPPIGTDFDPVQMADYAAQWEKKTACVQACWLPGVGDHGGGPTRDMLTKARRWQESPLFPTVTFSTPEEFVRAAVGHGQAIEKEEVTGPASHELPVWNDELYLELHRGCYTAHSDQKQQNRWGEDLLYQAEVWATVAQVLTGQTYPQATLEAAWKDLLFNQFHDILPGSAIPEVFEDANRQWGRVQTSGRQVLTASLAAISAHVGASAHGMPLFVFNAHSWPRTGMVDVTVPLGPWQIIDCETHQPVPHVVKRGTSPWDETVQETEHVLSFVAEHAPAVGYRQYALLAAPADAEEAAIAAAKVATNERRAEPVSQGVTPDFTLENEHLRVVISPVTGEIMSCVHRLSGRELFRAAANQLQCFEDSGQYWDAWNIAPDYGERPCDPAVLLGIEWRSQHPLCQQLRVTRRLNQSMIVQDYCLEAESRLLKVETWVDWQETQVVLKVNFPVTVMADHVTYEVPFGAIERPTQPTTDHERAKWEVPALRWADLSDADPAALDDGFGVSILTDCKHGYDAQPSQLRLTLLKAPLWPDPGCDRGHHHFTYAIYPHSGNWQTARTPHYAQAFNLPLKAHIPKDKPNTKRAPEVPTSTPIRHSFLSLESEHLMLSAFKPSQTDQHHFIARYYDAYGLPSQRSSQSLTPPITNSLGLTPGPSLNLLEEPIVASQPMRPYQIQTHRLCLKDSKVTP